MINADLKSRIEFLGGIKLSPAGLIWFFLALISFLGSCGLFNVFASFGWFITAFLNVWAVYHSRHFMPLIIILLFNALFFFYAVPHFFFDVSIVQISVADGLPYLTQVLWTISLFVAVLMVWVDAAHVQRNRAVTFLEMVGFLMLPKSALIFYFLLFVLLVATIFGVRGAVVLGVDGGYDAYVENLVSASGLQEYLLVLFFISGAMIKSGMQRFLWRCVLAFFVVKLSLVGLRIVALMGILAGLWFSDLNLSFKRTVWLFFLGFLLMSVLGLLKGGGFEVENVIFEIHGDSLVSHHSNVLWASTAILRLIDAETIDFFRRIDLLFYYMINTIVPSGLIQSVFGVPYFGSWLQQQGYSSGGGHAAIYLYVVGGPVAVVLSASLIGLSYKVGISSNQSLAVHFLRAWFMMLLITFPRWISYDIGNFLFRLPIYAALLSIFLILLGRTGSRYRNNACIND